MNNQNKSTLIEMSKEKLIPEITSEIKNELAKISVSTSNEDAEVIFETVAEKVKELNKRIEQLKSFFK